jgi:signal transduction histidine kinase
MAGDIERLERVAHRFERIGRPPQQEQVDAAEILERVTNYFGARVPTLSHAVALELRTSGDLPMKGDAVLIEWALEAVVKNSVDALAGRGGKIVIEGMRLPEGNIRVRVTDDGPGVPRELRRRVFEPGFTTKDRGWGIGLALAQRIVAQWHRGSLTLVPTDHGARFEFIFPG